MENIILFTPSSTYMLSSEINIKNEFKSMINMTYHFDLRGSTTAITDTSGNVTDQIAYGPYGELISKTGTTKTPFLFNGRDGVITDSNGLYYMRARYYNPEIKRFINQDVIQGNILDGGSLNRYAYVNGNPVSKTDPFGLSPELTPSKVGHTILDVLGFIPVIGEFANAANAIWYLAEGDYKNAALSAVCLIPYVGAGIIKGVKWGSTAFKEAKIGLEIAGYSSKILEYGKNVGRAISESASIFSEAWGKVNKGVTLSSNGIRSGNLGKVVKEFKEIKLAAKEAGETEKIAKDVVEAKPLKDWLEDSPDLLEETKQWYNEKPEWWSIDPEKTEIFYRSKNEVDEIRKLAGESGGHHPHGLALAGPEGQKLTLTGETRKIKNPTHSQVTGLQSRVIRVIKKKMGL